MRLIVSAFDSFGSDRVNASREALRALEAPQGMTLLKLELPTEFETAAQILLQTIQECKPDAVVCLGQAAGRSALMPERIAVNLRDASIPDNAGRIPQDEPIRPGAPCAYFSTLPIKRMVNAALAAGVPAAVSNSAGTFVCNDLMYLLLHSLNAEHPPIQAGFIHTPCLPEQAEMRNAPIPAMPLPLIVRGLSAMLETLPTPSLD